MQGLNACDCLLTLLEVDKSELAALGVCQDDRRCNGAKLAKLLEKRLLTPITGIILDIQVRVFDNLRLRTLAALQKKGYLYGLFSDLHTIDSSNRLLCRLLSLVVDKAISARFPIRLTRNLAGEDVSKQTEGIIESLIVNVAIQILHVDVACTALSKAWVSLAPHDSARAALDAGVVQCVERPLCICHGMEVHVAITQGAAGDTIAADADRSHGANRVEDFVQHRLCDIWVKIANIQGCKLWNAPRT
mmetsp:Transcript_49129/g.81547  ORF Transcript_49129/g.81547 Transcript_49129/m.81547 type:complete len:247 (+) Transcript_49129:622-1362(+)